MSTEHASLSAGSRSPRSAARARLKQKHEDEPWKKQYDLAVKQSLGLRLATPQGGNMRRNAFSNDDDMDDILSPSFEGNHNTPAGTNTTYGLESTSSADDSIIRRVEEEIAAARKAASGMNRKMQSPQRSSPTDVHIPGGTSETIHASSSEDSSKHRALIQDEFQEYDENPTTTLNETQRSTGVHIEMVYGQQDNNSKPRHPTPEQLYFTDEEWQVEESNSSDEIAQSSASQESEHVKPTLTVEATTSPQNLKDHEQHANLLKKKSPEHSSSPKSNHSSNPATEDRQEAEAKPKSPLGQGNTNNTSPQSAGSSKRDSPASSVAQNKEPEGVYSLPKDVISTPASIHCGKPDTANHQSADTSFSERTISSSLSTASRNSHQKTRELLDSLREQRELMATPKRRGAESSPNIPSSPRSPPTPISRATRARERIKTNNRTKQMETLDTSLDNSQSPQRTSSPRIPSSRTQSPRWSSSNRNLPDTAHSDSAEAHSVNDAERAKRIRFRNPFPVIKNQNTRRDADTIAQDHSVGVQEIPIRWVKPKQELKQLIVAAMGTSLPRRSNACGALKVLTQQPKNQLALVRTDGFLSALIFAASQSLVDIDRDLAIDARTRAVKCLKNVATPKDNRVLMMNHPGVLECLVKVIRTDGNEGRALATATVALLAKTPFCREGLAQVEGLIDVISRVVHGEDFIPMEDTQPLANNSAVRRKLNDSVSDVSTQSGSNVDENENQENIDDNEQQSELKKSVAESESSDEDETDEEDDDEDGEEEDDDYLSQPPPIEISHKKASPQLDSIRNKLEVRHQEFFNQSRANACATLLLLSRQCTITVC